MDSKGLIFYILVICLIAFGFFTLVKDDALHVKYLLDLKFINLYIFFTYNIVMALNSAGLVFASEEVKVNMHKVCFCFSFYLLSSFLWIYFFKNTYLDNKNLHFLQQLFLNGAYIKLLVIDHIFINKKYVTRRFGALFSLVFFVFYIALVVILYEVFSIDIFAFFKSFDVLQMLGYAVLCFFLYAIGEGLLYFMINKRLAKVNLELIEEL